MKIVEKNPPSHRTMKHPEKTYYIYILRCVNDTLYTGIARDITARLKEHNTGSHKSKYTRAFPPISCEAAWRIHTGRGDAQRIEAFIKKQPRERKLLILQHIETAQSIFVEWGFSDLPQMEIVKEYCSYPFSSLD